LYRYIVFIVDLLRFCSVLVVVRFELN